MSFVFLLKHQCPVNENSSISEQRPRFGSQVLVSMVPNSEQSTKKNKGDVTKSVFSGALIRLMGDCRLHIQVHKKPAKLHDIMQTPTRFKRLERETATKCKCMSRNSWRALQHKMALNVLCISAKGMNPFVLYFGVLTCHNLSFSCYIQKRKIHLKKETGSAGLLTFAYMFLFPDLKCEVWKIKSQEGRERVLITYFLKVEPQCVIFAKWRLSSFSEKTCFNCSFSLAGSTQQVTFGIWCDVWAESMFFLRLSGESGCQLI